MDGRRAAQENASDTVQHSNLKPHWPLLSPPLSLPIPFESCWSYSYSNMARAVTSSSFFRKEGRSVITTSKFFWIDRYLQQETRCQQPHADMHWGFTQGLLHLSRKPSAASCGMPGRDWPSAKSLTTVPLSKSTQTTSCTCHQ